MGMKGGIYMSMPLSRKEYLFGLSRESITYLEEFRKLTDLDQLLMD